jgi:hypothetical protein
MVQMKNKIAVLLMESGGSYNKQKLHKVGCFRELLATNQEIDKPYFGDKRDEKTRLLQGFGRGGGDRKFIPTK